MWTRKPCYIGGVGKFFLIALSHIDLLSYFKLNFAMKQHHHWSLFEMEEMMPWEREIYVTLLKQHIEEENEKIRLQNNG